MGRNNTTQTTRNKNIRIDPCQFYGYCYSIMLLARSMSYNKNTAYSFKSFVYCNGQAKESDLFLFPIIGGIFYVSFLNFMSEKRQQPRTMHFSNNGVIV